MKVKVYSELTAFRKKNFIIYSVAELFLGGMMIYGLLTNYFEGEPAWLVILCFLAVLLLYPLCLLENVFFILTINDDYVSISAGAERKLPKKIKLNDSRDVYLMTAEYSATKSSTQNGFLISNAPIENADKKFLRKNTLTVVYSQNFLHALKEHTNLHIIGELKEEVDVF